MPHGDVCYEDDQGTTHEPPYSLLYPVYNCCVLCTCGGLQRLRITVPKSSHLYIASKQSVPVSFFAEGTALTVLAVQPPKGERSGDDTVLRGTGDFKVSYTGGRKGYNIIKVKYQLCLDDAGVCLTPATVPLDFTLSEDSPRPQKKKDLFEAMAGMVGGDGNVAIALLVCFLAGIASFLLPCVYPLIPITISYLGTQTDKKTKSFLGSLLFGIGIVVTYTLLGIIVTAVGRVTNIQFGSIAYHPFVLVPLVLFFLYFTFSMFGFYEFKLPSFMHQAKDRAYKRGDSYVGKFFMGAVTGLVASPCVGPVVASILAISLTQPQYGYLYMFFYALGFASVLVLLGTFSSLIGKLPKSGGWMDIVKYIFGLMMLGFTAYYLDILFLVLGVKNAATYLTIAIISLAAIMLTLLGFKKLDSYLKSDRLKALVVVLLFLTGLSITRVVQLELFNTNARVETRALPEAANLDEAVARAASENKLVLVDFNAVWCENCELLSERILKQPPVSDLISQRFIFVSVDVDHEPEYKKRYNIQWLPWIVVLNAEGKPIYERNSFGLFNKELSDSLFMELSSLR
ncbi:MAG: sulfite exporter TauE/SafE family protein [Spirochaetes bacterium]|nr:sulfite exporter TauE/SafE family protein [Spirochaetota bacterium]